jgi:hypothetical protein
MAVIESSCERRSRFEHQIMANQTAMNALMIKNEALGLYRGIR